MIPFDPSPAGRWRRVLEQADEEKARSLERRELPAPAEGPVYRIWEAALTHPRRIPLGLFGPWARMLPTSRAGRQARMVCATALLAREQKRTTDPAWITEILPDLLVPLAACSSTQEAVFSLAASLFAPGSGITEDSVVLLLERLASAGFAPFAWFQDAEAIRPFDAEGLARLEKLGVSASHPAVGAALLEGWLRSGPVDLPVDRLQALWNAGVHPERTAATRAHTSPLLRWFRWSLDRSPPEEIEALWRCWIRAGANPAREHLGAGLFHVLASSWKTLRLPTQFLDVLQEVPGVRLFDAEGRTPIELWRKTLDSPRSSQFSGLSQTEVTFRLTRMERFFCLWEEARRLEVAVDGITPVAAARPRRRF